LQILGKFGFRGNLARHVTHLGPVVQPLNLVYVRNVTLTAMHFLWKSSTTSCSSTEPVFEHSLKEQSRTKSLIKPTWSKKSFKHTFGILIKFHIQYIEKTLQNLVQSLIKAVSKFELLKTHFKRTVWDKIACKTHGARKGLFSTHF